MRISGLLSDLRQALRSLARRPGFTAITILTLALGIGAATAVFTLVDGVLLKALPFAQPDELVSLTHAGRDGQDQLPMSPGLYLLYRDQSRTLEAVAMFNQSASNLMADGEPERVIGQSVTPSFFAVLGTDPAMGRSFTEEEGAPGGEAVVMLSDGLWRSRFGGDPSIVGRTVEMSGTSRQVVGIMAQDFGYPDRSARFWVPMVMDETQAPLASFSANGIGRIAQGSTIEAVQAEIAGMMTRLTDLFPGDRGATFLMEVNLQGRVASLKESLVGNVTRTLWVLFGMVGFVLAIACANVANLLLVRAEGRQREMALRVAVGAGRLDVIRSFMAESLGLAVLGGGLGLGLAAGSIRLIKAVIPSDLPRMDEVGMDLRVLGFTATLVLGSVLFFGLLPMIRFGAENLAARLRAGDGARGATGGKEHHRLRSGLVVAQVALALVLLVGSGLMFRSFQALRAVDPGFDPEGTLTARIIVPPGEIQGWEETAGFFRQLRDRLADQPGVVSVGLVNAVPLGGFGTSFGGMEVEDHPRGPEELPIFAALPQADVGYFEAMGIRVLEGRPFQRGDGGDGARVAVVSRSFAEAWWPQASALGRRIRFGAPNEDWYEIVGVVEDVREEGLDQPIRETAYFPTVTEADGQYSPTRVQDVVIRTNGDPLSFIPTLRNEMRALNPRIPLADPRTMETVFDRATSRTSFTMAMLGASSSIALLLGLVGIYGVISYLVSQRTKEIGIRMAVGASASSVSRMVVRQGAVMAITGVALGLVVAALASTAMASLLFGVSATDPLTYVAVGASLIAVATGASWIPAVRAAGVDPSRALRAE